MVDVLCTSIDCRHRWCWSWCSSCWCCKWINNVMRRCFLLNFHFKCCHRMSNFNWITFPPFPFVLSLMIGWVVWMAVCVGVLNEDDMHMVSVFGMCQSMPLPLTELIMRNRSMCLIATDTFREGRKSNHRWLHITDYVHRTSSNNKYTAMSINGWLAMILEFGRMTDHLDGNRKINKWTRHRCVCESKISNHRRNDFQNINIPMRIPFNQFTDD